MDLKTTKHSVFINEVVYSQKAEVPFDIDFTMPDYCPDIMKILKCRAVARIASKSINGQNITVDGHIAVNVIYCNSENQIYNYEQISPFNKTFESGMDLGDGIVECNAKTEYLNCRAVTEKRIDIHGAASLIVSVKCKKKYDIIAQIENDDIQLNKEYMPALNSIASAEKSLLIEEDLELGTAQASIENIIRYEAVPIITETKAIRNKVIVKGNLAITVFYCSNGHKKYLTYRCSVPFSQFLDINGVTEECKLNSAATLCFVELKPKKYQDECRFIALNAKICIGVNAYCDGEISVISDAYSTKKELKLQSCEVALEREAGCLKDSHLLKFSMEFLNGISSVIDCWSDTVINNIKCANGKIVISGTTTACILALDGQENVIYNEKNCDFTYEKNCEQANNPLTICTADFENISTSYTLTTDNEIEFRTENKVLICFKEKQTVSVLCDIAFLDTAKQKENNCCLLIYYADAGESVWEIAKRYNSNINELCEINGLNEKCIKEKKTLLIPVC